MNLPSRKKLSVEWLLGWLEGNFDLSKRRAAAVKEALVKQNAIAADRLTAKGVPHLAPVSTNATDAGTAEKPALRAGAVLTYVFEYCYKNSTLRPNFVVLAPVLQNSLSLRRYQDA